MTHTAPPASGRGDAALSVRGLGKAFRGTVALRDVDLTIARGEVHGLVGQNGSGKSTLVKIISGYERPDAGKELAIGGVRVKLRSPHDGFLAGCRVVHQDIGLIDTLSVADNLSLNGGWPTRLGTIEDRAMAQRAREMLGALDLDLDPMTPAGDLSPAMRTGVAVARALQADARAALSLLVLDEPTATLPRTEADRLLEVVRSVAAGGVGVLLVSHHLEEVIETADAVTVLRDGRVALTRPARGLTRRELVGAMLGHDAGAGLTRGGPRAGPSAQPLLEVGDLVASTVAGVSLSAFPGELIGIAGIAGSGRGAVLPAIFGATARWGGRVRVAGRVIPPGAPRRSIVAGVAFVPADRARQAGIATLSARENLTLADLRPAARRARLSLRAERAEAERWFERLDIRPAGVAEMPFASFSGGNQQKIVLARWLRRKPRIVLLDEPTQGVDVGAQARLHAEVLAIAGSGATVVLSSSDPDELVALCDRVVVMWRGEIAHELSGADVSARAISRAALAPGEVS